MYSNVVEGSVGNAPAPATNTRNAVLTATSNQLDMIILLEWTIQEPSSQVKLQRRPKAPANGAYTTLYIDPQGAVSGEWYDTVGEPGGPVAGTLYEYRLEYQDVQAV
jgi:hypothetical protein